jgi:hypothetical protein
MAYTTGNIVGPQFLEILGLPKNTRWFELRCAVDEVVSVTACHVVEVENEHGFIDHYKEVFKKYKLVEKNESGPATG